MLKTDLQESLSERGHNTAVQSLQQKSESAVTGKRLYVTRARKSLTSGGTGTLLPTGPRYTFLFLGQAIATPLFSDTTKTNIEMENSLSNACVSWVKKGVRRHDGRGRMGAYEIKVHRLLKMQKQKTNKQIRVRLGRGDVSDVSCAFHL